MYRDFNKIYDEFYLSVLNFVNVRLSNNTELAYELTNDIFIKIYNNVDSFDETQAKLSTWIFTIAKNTIIDQYRKNAQKIKMNTLSELDDKSDGMFNIISEYGMSDSNINNSELRNKILYEINNLPQQIRLICKLRFIDEYSYDEICEKLNKNLGTVKANIFRAKEILKKSLKVEYNNLS